ncbi:Uncharacterised protein [Mycobacteroides abscessus]|nr:Uncharacterised protein [Mycobacteroides abscessus]CPU63262.1 Uncharacterised protein [Mycobacteroides abscessus]SKK67824.1 Uncharacterised protein [Mycobacteroides abscessus subsp. massiliense]SKQ42553.1 Uncharacterised protein [Mycobacteroides abscessus subsp. massiliense]SKW99021.1 Uncharacterised protein [Mycobacteroides abscessus subsp. massiliense]
MSPKGLASDELFAVPTTCTPSVYVENATARENCDVESAQADTNHDIHPTASRDQPRSQHTNLCYSWRN